MKLKGFFKYSWILVASMFATGCSDEPIPQDEEIANLPGELTLTVSLPDFQVTEVGSRASADAAISSLAVMCYSKQGALLSTFNVTAGFVETGTNTFQVTVPLDKHTVSLQFIANMTPPSGISDFSAYYTDNPDAKVMWGKADLKDLLAKPVSSRTVQLLRQNAKVTVVDNAADFTISRFGVYGTASVGSVAPAGQTLEPTTPTIKAGEGFGFNKTKGEAALKGASEVVNIFETTKDDQLKVNNEVVPGEYKTRGRVIIEGTYNGVKGYYVVAFRTRGYSGSGYSETPGAYTYEPVHVLRNHHYKVTVTEVRAAGWPTLAEAMTAEADNRLTALVTDTNDNINSITANSDYMLGVSDKISASYNAGSVALTVITSNPAASSIRLSLSDDADWILTEGYSIPSYQSTQPVNSLVNKTGFVYTLNIPLQTNKNEKERVGTVTVRSGELTRTVKVTQLGANYKLDPNRKVIMTMDGLQVTADYYSWMTSGTLHGVAPESFCQEGVVRNDGLHFPAVPAYTAVYKIPVLSGDSNAKIASGGSYFTLTTSGGYYQISMNSQSAPGIAIGSFTLTNADGATVTYPLYRTGYIHELKSSHATYQRNGGAITGWFYYEVVPVMYGGSTRWTLDRNLGASSNFPYIPTSSKYQSHTEAIGGYFKVSTTKSSDVNAPATVTSNLGISRFQLPWRTELEQMGLNLKVEYAGVEPAYLLSMTALSPSTLGTVYIPQAGYYDGDELCDPTHGCLWTRTLVSGNQGFSQSSPDFGYWYHYLDVIDDSNKIGYSKMQMMQGAVGEGITSTTLFRYMPLRLIWN